MRHNYSPSARGAKINQLDWVSLTKKFDQRQPNVTIPDFIESEITPILGFRMGESTFSKRVIIGVAFFFIPTFVNIIMDLANIVWQGLGYTTCNI